MQTLHIGKLAGVSNDLRVLTVHVRRCLVGLVAAPQKSCLIEFPGADF